MGIQIEDSTGSGQGVGVSPTGNRLNTSSRSDNRAYYNSRDEGQTYSMVYSHPSAADGQYSFYLQNTSTDKTLVVSSIGLNADDLAKFKLCYVTGTAANGVAVVPVNLNRASANDAICTAISDEGGTAISGLTTDGCIDTASVVVNGHEEFRLGDKLRLGQNDAIALEMDAGTSTPDCYGVVFFYFE